MYILRLLRIESLDALRDGILITCLAGLGNVTLIGLINAAAERVAFGRPVGMRMAAMYLIAFGIFYVADRVSLREANRLLQRRLADLRLHIADKIRRAELRPLELLGRGEIYATVAQETNHLSQNFPLLVSAAQSLFLLGFCLLYIAILSQISFFVVSSVTTCGLVVFWSRRRTLRKAMVEVHTQETAMLGSLTHFTEGFQEIRLNANKNDALQRRLIEVVDDLETKVVGIGRSWVVLLMFSNAFLYFLVGVVIFVLPMFFSGYTDVIYKIAAVSIFCVGPVTAVTSAAPLFDKANVGLEHVYRLEQQLDQGTVATTLAPVPDAEFRNFSKIAFDRIAFSYRNTAGQGSFTVGPWTFTLDRGEIVFLTGGNGSGKSTALKLICGLYQADAGRILVDDVEVTSDRLQAYREMFSCIFPDFHLFDRLYGIEAIDPLKVQGLIERMELADKVAFADGRFSTQALSTGQRKRLAMIVSLLEDRDVYLFDEWAADQDAHFRELFYTSLLPEMKRLGKTIVVVTHDDRYWHLCDRRITLDLGDMVATAVDRTSVRV
jgi:putative pyoverdin transport system ATP-binding/permease protein